MHRIQPDCMRIPIVLRAIAAVVCTVAQVWAIVLVVQGRFGLSLLVGTAGALCGRLAFAPMRESAY